MEPATAVLALICVGLTSATVGFVLGQFLESRARDRKKLKVS